MCSVVVLVYVVVLWRDMNITNLGKHYYYFFINLSWLMRFLVLNSLCLIPLNLYLSGNTILILGIWIPLRVQYLLGFISNFEFFRYVYGILDIFISSILSFFSFLISFMSDNEYWFMSDVDLDWYVNLIILTIQCFLIIFCFLFLIHLTITLYHKLFS